MEEEHRVKDLALEEEEKCSNLMGKVEVDDLVKHSHNIPNILRGRSQDQTIVHISSNHSSKNDILGYAKSRKPYPCDAYLIQWAQGDLSLLPVGD